MKNYDAREEEKIWRRRGPKDSKKQRLFPEKHNFVHSHVRSKLYDTLVGLGCTKKSSILEIGCGTGEDAEFVSKASSNIIGVDISPDAIKSYITKGFEGIIADAKVVPFKDDYFDYVLYSATLHHLVGQGNLIDYLRESVRVTRPQGYVIALEPNLFNLSGILMNIFNTVRPGITGLVPHERALSPLYLVQVFKDAGLKNVRCVSASYVWNRFPLWLSQFISSHEDRFRQKRPFNLLGWFEIVYGQKS